MRTHGPSSAARETPQESLEEALAAARDGSEHGFGVLWRALHPPLLRYLSVRAGDSPEDVASETWFQVIRDLPSFRGNAGDFRAWLFTVARNRAIDAGRARAARPAVPLHDATPDDRPVPSAETVALENVSTAAALEMVATLPTEQAEMVLLRVVAGLDVATVARMVGRRPGTVRVAVHRALQRLSRDVRVQAAREVV